MKLGVELFRALAAVAWADGRMDSSEAEALVRAGRAAGLTDDELASLKHATTSHLSLADVGPLSLQGEDAEYAYALACLITAADGRVVDEERETLKKLGDSLSLSAEARERAQTASAAIADTLGVISPMTALAGAIEAE